MLRFGITQRQAVRLASSNLFALFLKSSMPPDVSTESAGGSLPMLGVVRGAPRGIRASARMQPLGRSGDRRFYAVGGSGISDAVDPCGRSHAAEIAEG